MANYPTTEAERGKALIEDRHHHLFIGEFVHQGDPPLKGAGNREVNPGAKDFCPDVAPGVVVDGDVAA